MRIARPSIHSGLPPGPKGTLLGGNVRQFRAGLLDFLLDTAHDYGPLSSFRIGPRRVFLVETDSLQARAGFGLDSANLFNPPSSRLTCSPMPR